VKPDLV